MTELIIDSLVSLAPLFYLLGIITAFALVFNLFRDYLANYLRGKKYKKLLTNENTLKDLVYKLRPDEFEDCIGELLPKLGYQAVAVIGGINQGDGGFDLRAEKNGQKYYIQVKKYGFSHPVGVNQVREFYGALKADHPEARGIFITTSFFTYGFLHNAEDFAKKVGIELVDGNRLLGMIYLANKKSA